MAQQNEMVVPALIGKIAPGVSNHRRSHSDPAKLLGNDLGDDFKWTGAKSTRDQYDFEFPLLWDAHKTRGCVCDPKWTDVDCGTRMCPRSDFSRLILSFSAFLGRPRCSTGTSSLSSLVG